MSEPDKALTFAAQINELQEEILKSDKGKLHMQSRLASYFSSLRRP